MMSTTITSKQKQEMSTRRTDIVCGRPSRCVGKVGLTMAQALCAVGACYARSAGAAARK